MPLPIAPIARFLIVSGVASAAVRYAMAQKAQKEKHVWHEAALDDVKEGFHAERYDDKHESQVKFQGGTSRRIVLLTGHAFEIDAHGLGRIRIKRKKPGE